MDLPNFKSAKEKAIAILQKYDIAEPIIPVFEIAQREGLKIIYFNPEDEFKDVSGFLDIVEKNIYINQDESPRRQMFTVAHELGHFIFNHQNTNVLFRYVTAIDKDPKEKEANFFAVNLLVPLTILNFVLNKYYLSKNDTDLLSQFFGVTIDVINYRLNFLK